MATWNGNFMRNTNGSGSVNYDELQKVFGKNSVMTMAGNTTGAMFETLSTTTNSNYPGFCRGELAVWRIRKKRFILFS